MDIISLSDEAFYALLKHVSAHLKEHYGLGSRDKWISGEEAMQMLRISSKTTLQKMRDNGDIRFTQPERKIILYDSDSIMEYLEKHAKDTF